jgi:hypothetical protein
MLGIGGRSAEIEKIIPIVKVYRWPLVEAFALNFPGCLLGWLGGPASFR